MLKSDRFNDDVRFGDYELGMDFMFGFYGPIDYKSLGSLIDNKAFKVKAYELEGFKGLTESKIKIIQCPPERV